MGLCHDFGSQIAEHCSHPMRAGFDACTCDECGVVCSGLFEACSEVWARGPHPVLLTSRLPSDVQAPAAQAPANGQHRQREPDPPPPMSADRRSNGAAAAVPEASAGAARTEVFRWFEREFGALRDEVASLRAALAQRQEPHEPAARGGGGTRPEDLAALVDAAVAKAVADHFLPLEHSVTGLLKSLRRELKEARLSNERGVLALRDAIAESMSVPDSQLAPLAEAVADSAAQSESLLSGLAEAVADSASQSAAELAALRRRLDRVAQASAPPPADAAMARPKREVRVSLRDHAPGTASHPG